MSEMTIVPLTLREANAFVQAHHRHNPPTPQSNKKRIITRLRQAPMGEIFETVKEEPVMKTHTPQTKTRGGYILTATFILAALLIVLVVLYSARHTEPKQYSLKIMELGGESMLAHSDSEELGLGEILLVYDKDMVVEDVNGQIIEFAELGLEDGIRVEIAPREKDPDYDRYLDPVVKRIILLPDDSDDYI